MRLLTRLRWARCRHDFVATDPLAKDGASLKWLMFCRDCGMDAVADVTDVWRSVRRVQ